MTRLLQYLTALAALLLAALCSWGADEKASPQLFVEGSFHDVKGAPVGWFRQVCADKKAAQDLCAKYTNSVSGIAPGLDVRARVHTCWHDSVPPKSCTTELLSKEEPDLSNAETNYCVVVKEVTTLEKQSVKDNPPTFKVPAVKGQEAPLIAKVVLEFSGKPVTTNTTAISAEAK